MHYHGHKHGTEPSCKPRVFYVKESGVPNDAWILVFHVEDSVIGHFRVAFCLCFKRVLVHNLCYGNEFDFHHNKHAGKTHFHNKGRAPGLVLKQRQKATQKWPIVRDPA